MIFEGFDEVSTVAWLQSKHEMCPSIHPVQHREDVELDETSLWSRRRLQRSKALRNAAGQEFIIVKLDIRNCLERLDFVQRNHVRDQPGQLVGQDEIFRGKKCELYFPYVPAHAILDEYLSVEYL